MRLGFATLLAIGLLTPGLASAQTATSSLRITRSVAGSGQVQTVAVMARDLAGQPLSGASVVAQVRYGSVSRTYHMHHTDATGTTSVSFHVPPAVANLTAIVSVSISNGFLSQSLSGHFRVSSLSNPSAAKAPVSRPPLAAPTASLQIVTRVLPQSVTPPDPVWVVVYVRNRSGKEIAGAHVTLTATFKEGSVRVSGTTDKSGVATLRLDTTHVRLQESVHVAVSATTGAIRGSGTGVFSVAKPRAASAQPTAVATVQPAPLPAGAMATPTWTPVPSFVLPTPTRTPTPTITPVPTYTPVATWTPVPTWTPIPTNTPVPAPTFTPTPTASPTPASSPTVLFPAPDCPGSQTGCIQAMVNILNQTRGQYNLPPLAVDMTQSNGTGNCPGAYGHSQHMANEGMISHDQFPADICVSAGTEGENVGMFQGPNIVQDLQSINSLMMSENPNTPAGCAGGVVNHACNIISSKFTSVGIGVYIDHNTVWLTEDFLG